MTTTLDRFMAKVAKDPETGCWVWTAARISGGYGQFRTRSFPSAFAHRWSYVHFVGPIPEGLELDHLCRNRLCVNPEHLEPVTRRVNMLRGDTFAARQAAQTHCIHGHSLLDPSNVRLRRGTQRNCKTCDRERTREYARRKRVA